MKLRNKKTGEVLEVLEIITLNNINYFRFKDKYGCYKKEFNSLKELNEDWEDYEEPKEYWYVSCAGKVEKATQDEDDFNVTHINGHKAIGNYFETEEEAEKAVEKLKAWKRLRDNGIYYSLDTMGKKHMPVIKLHSKEERGTLDKVKRIYKDLLILFGGEE